MFICHFLYFLNFENPRPGYLTVTEIVNSYNSQKAKLVRDLAKGKRVGRYFQTPANRTVLLSKRTQSIKTNYLTCLKVVFIRS